MVKYTKPALLFLAGILVFNIIFTTVNLKFKSLRESQFQNTNVTLSMRQTQLDCLAKNIYYEAGSEPFEGKVGIEQVTLNRVNSGQFPNDICKEIGRAHV